MMPLVSQFLPDSPLFSNEREQGQEVRKLRFPQLKGLPLEKLCFR